MFGTAATFRVPVEKVQAFRDVYLKENAPYCAGLDGFVAEYILQPADSGGEWVSLTIFDSEESYQASTVDPGVHAIYRRLVAIIAEEPRWHRGTITLSEARTVAL